MEPMLNAAFNQMKLEYQNIINHCIPKRGSSGFMEANLTFYFVKNFLALLNKGDILVKDCRTSAFAWFEAPVGDAGRIDAIISDYERKAIFIIESKRLYKNQREKKQAELVEQISRLTPNRINDLISKFDLDDHEKVHVYVIILADLWEECNWQQAKRWWDSDEDEPNCLVEKLNELNCNFKWKNKPVSTKCELSDDRKEEGIDYHLLFGFDCLEMEVVPKTKS